MQTKRRKWAFWLMLIGGLGNLIISAYFILLTNIGLPEYTWLPSTIFAIITAILIWKSDSKQTILSYIVIIASLIPVLFAFYNIAQDFGGISYNLITALGFFLEIILLFALPSILAIIGSYFELTESTNNGGYSNTKTTHQELQIEDADVLKTLKMRYAKGEITKKQYDKMRKDLEE